MEILKDFPIGSKWQRADIHERLGGQVQGGISTPRRNDYIILFSSKEGERYGYKDGWNADGTYHFTGEGQKGNMEFKRGNKALLNHKENGKSVLLFETDEGGLRRFEGVFEYAHYTHEDLPDITGETRNAIVFKLKRIM